MPAKPATGSNRRRVRGTPSRELPVVERDGRRGRPEKKTPPRAGAPAGRPRRPRLVSRGATRGNRRLRSKPPVERQPAERTPTRRSRFAGLVGGFWQRRRQLGRRAIVVVLVAGLGYVGYLGYRFVIGSPHFRVKRVEVSPTVRVTAKEVRRLAAIGPRTNIFFVDLGKVAARIKRHPWVARARVHRRLPSTIRIEIDEEEAVGAVLMAPGKTGAQSRFYLVNEQGRPFKVATPKELTGLPLITGLGRADYVADPKAGATQIRGALAAYRRYATRDGRPHVGEVHVDPTLGLTFYTASRAVQIRLGRGKVGAKLDRLDRVFAELRRQGQRPLIIRLDNERHPERVTVRLAGK